MHKVGRCFEFCCSALSAGGKTLRYAKVLFFIFSFVFLSAFLVESWPVARTLLASDTLMFSIVSISLAHLLVPLVSKILLSGVLSRPYGVFLRSHVLKLPARYIPGGVWQTVGKSYDVHSWGVPKSSVVRFFLFESLLSLVVAFTLGIGIFVCLNFPAAIYIYPVVVIGVIFFLKAASIFLKFNCCWKAIIWTTFLYGLIWSLIGGGYSLFLNSGQAEPAFLMELSLYLLSWSAGFIAIFAPQGIGVQEVVYANIAVSGVSAETAALSIFLFRFVVFLGEMMIYIPLFISSIIRRRF